MTVFNWVNRSAELLKNIGFENVLFEARFLAALSLNKNISWILSHPGELINQSIADNYLYRRLNHEPLAYIAGKKEFWGREFMVDSRVLIPRQETEELVEVALTILPLNSDSRILDLCTGSGCIGITLKLERPFLDVSASDISLEALEVAKFNSLKLGVNIHLYSGNLFDFCPKICYDLIVCNPPYIANTDIISKEICDYEPPHALWAEKNGFDFYERISAEAIQYVCTTGRLILEVGYNQSKRVKEIFQSRNWELLDSKLDLYGLERCLIFQKSR